jgi:hypothetical protein
MKRSTARNWYRSAEEFHQVCLDATSLAKGEAAEEFAHRKLAQATAWGLDTFLSASELRWLCELADHVMPLDRGDR